MSDDHFSDFDEESTTKPVVKAIKVNRGTKKEYSTEVFSEKISAKYRTFFIDVKENDNGHLIKISEKSRGGKKSTVMFDGEDLDELIEILQKAKDVCDGE